MKHLGAELVAKKFPGMVKRCADCGFDLAGGRVEVVPTAHYQMGGVVVDVDTRTSLAGLFVAGEDAGGSHGANRLGGNGVANSTVFGGIAGDEMAVQAAKQQHWQEPELEAVEAAISDSLRPFSQPVADINRLRDRLLDLMWEGVGVLRDANGLQKAQAEITALQSELAHSGLSDQNRVFNLSWHDWLNLRSLLDVSAIIAAAALSRENSRGAHYREDFTETGSLEQSYFTVARQSAAGPVVDREAVDFSIVKPGESLLDDD
jgi:fumarate reductase flavoprotein subunit